MYFDFEDYRPDISPVGRAISWREGVLLSIIFHLTLIIVILVAPKWLPESWRTAKAVPVEQAPQESPRFVFVQPHNDLTAPKAPNRAEASDKDRVARAPERAPNPKNPLPFARGNSPERVEAQQDHPVRGQGPSPEPAAGQQADNTPQPTPDFNSALQSPTPRATTSVAGANGRSSTPGGSLGDALRNLQRYVQKDSFDNPGGSGGQFGPEIQFDTKGVEFGPWIRRFIAQVKRNWFVPYAAMSLRGHVVIQFNVHKDGSITDLVVVGPAATEAFNNAAFGALSSSNPTQPLPPEYPTEKAFFTVTFFYNESPQ
jgi:TonB family protein